MLDAPIKRESRQDALVWKALADPTRRRILDLLRDGPQATGEIAGAFPSVTRFAVMKHLRALEEANLVLRTRKGRQRLAHLNAAPLRRVYERWVSAYADLWAGSLLNLSRVSASETRARPERKPMAFKPTMTATVHRLEQEHCFDAPPQRVFEALTREIGQWWWRGEDGKGPPAVIEPFVGGRMYHDGGQGKGHLYGHIAEFEPPSRLKITGDFCNRQACYNVVTIRLEARDGGGTTLRLTHQAAGEADDAFMASFDEGWGWGFKALRSHLERTALT